MLRGARASWCTTCRRRVWAGKDERPTSGASVAPRRSPTASRCSQQRQPAQGCRAQRGADRRSPARASLVGAVASDLATRQVDAVVAESLVEAREQCQFDRHRQRHRTRRQLGGERDVQVVELVVDVLDRAGDSSLPSMMMSVASRQMVDATSPIRSTSPRLRGDISLPSPRAARRAMCSARSPLRSISGRMRSSVISDARLDAERRVSRPGGPRRWRPWRHEVVDDDVLVDDALGQFAVVGEQGVGRPGDGLADQGEDLHDLLAQFRRHTTSEISSLAGSRAEFQESATWPKVTAASQDFSRVGETSERGRMMVGLIGGVAGLLVGAAVAWVVASSRAQSLREGHGAGESGPRGARFAARGG
jgi:hypothetical protein